jgi:hypothetical protein
MASDGTAVDVGRIISSFLSGHPDPGLYLRSLTAKDHDEIVEGLISRTNDAEERLRAKQHSRLRRDFGLANIRANYEQQQAERLLAEQQEEVSPL